MVFQQCAFSDRHFKEEEYMWIWFYSFWFVTLVDTIKIISFILLSVMNYICMYIRRLCIQIQLITLGEINEITLIIYVNFGI
jgi:hypothetical protein